VKVLRTPDARFVNLPGWAFEPHYLELPHAEGASLTMHYADAGPLSAAPVLLLHGEPSWAYLYRKMIPIIAGAGHRAIAPDLIGFGRSDKPARREDYTYQRHVNWMHGFIDALDLKDITLVCQDWGGLIGLRVAAEQPDRFARIVAANTFLPTGDRPPGEAFMRWQHFSQGTPVFNVGRIVNGGCLTDLPQDIIAAYDAPFPNESYKEGARQFPLLVPTSPEDPAAPANKRAWETLRHWTKPFLTAFSDSDPVTRGAERVLQSEIPGAKDQPHTTITGAGHFLQEDKGEDVASIVIDFIASTRR
jgi:haloalkane dehalogenase